MSDFPALRIKYMSRKLDEIDRIAETRDSLDSAHLNQTMKLLKPPWLCSPKTN